MAAAAILKNEKNHHMSAAIGAIKSKFGTVKQFDLLGVFDCSKFKIFEIQDNGGRHFEKSISRLQFDRFRQNFA